MRLYLKIEGPVLNVDMFEIEVVENIPLTKVGNFHIVKSNTANQWWLKVSRGKRVKKKEMIKIKDFLRDNGLNSQENSYKPGTNIEITDWTKIEMVIPTQMKYR